MHSLTENCLYAAPLFTDRQVAGTALAAKLADERGPEAVVVGLARGGGVVAAEIADVLEAPLDVVAVRKVRHPWQPEYGIGAVTPGEGIYLRGRNGLSDEELAAAVDHARKQAALLDRRLHFGRDPLELSGKTVVVVDDGLATGATMIAALRWAHAADAARVVAAVPVASVEGLDLIHSEADEIVCVHARSPFFAVGFWYGSFDRVDDAEVVRLLDASRRARTERALLTKT